MNCAESALARVVTVGTKCRMKPHWFKKMCVLLPPCDKVLNYNLVRPRFQKEKFSGIQNFQRLLNSSAIF